MTDEKTRRLVCHLTEIAFGSGHSTLIVRLVVAMLVWVACPTVATTPLGIGTAVSDKVQSHSIAVELNRTESVSDGCRLSFVIRNHRSHAFTSLQWDLVFFDPNGLIAGRMAAEAAPLAAGATSVKLYEVPRLGCDRLQRILLNGVLRCETKPEDAKPVDCLRLTAPSSRTTTDFFK